MHPILIQTDFFTFYTHWLIFGLGVILSAGIFLKSAKRKKLPLEILERHFILLTIVSLIGARIGFVLKNFFFYPEERSWKQFLLLFTIWDGNWSFLSGLVVFLTVFFILVVKMDKENVRRWFDTATVPLLTLLLFGHVGDFFEGSNYGRPSQTPWAIIFENAQVLYTVPIHPTQLYAGIYTLIIILMVSKYNHVLDHILPKIDGRDALSAILMYSFFRFLEGFVRGDEVLKIFSLRVPELTSLIIFAISLSVIIRYRKKHI